MIRARLALWRTDDLFDAHGHRTLLKHVVVDVSAITNQKPRRSVIGGASNIYGWFRLQLDGL